MSVRRIVNLQSRGIIVKRYFKTTIVVTVVLTLVIVSGAKWFLNRKLKGSEKVTTVRIEVVEPSELVEFVTAPGEIEPLIKVDISAKVSALLEELPFEEGRRVTKGDPDADPPIPASVLIKLDSKDLESRLRSAEASYHGQEANVEVEKAQIARQKSSLEGTAATLKQAGNDFARQKKLLESRDISQATFDQIECNLNELKAQYAAAGHALKASELGLVVLQHNLEASREMIEQAKEALSYTTITSPIDGVVTRINAEVGEVVMTGTMNNPGTIIMQVADLSQMLLVAQVDEADIGNLRVGQKATIRVQAFWDDKFTGVVDTIALTHDLSVSRTKYYKTEILLDEGAKKLHSGLTADVDIETVRHEGILKVPSQSVVSRKVDDLPLEIRRDNPNVDMAKTDCLVVYRLVDGKAAVTPVSIGPSDMTHIIIKSGLNVADKVVTGPYKVLAGTEGRSLRGLTTGGIKHGQRIQDEKEVEKEKHKRAQADGEPNKP